MSNRQEMHVCEVCFRSHVPDPCCVGCPCGTGAESRDDTTSSPLLPSALAVGDVIEWTTVSGDRFTGSVFSLTMGNCDAAVTWGPGDIYAPLHDRDAERLAIRVVRRATMEGR